jgi:hypothetical protein
VKGGVASEAPRRAEPSATPAQPAADSGVRITPPDREQRREQPPQNRGQNIRATTDDRPWSAGPSRTVRYRPGLRGGGSGIRTHGGLPHTRFPSVPIRPLSHPSWGSPGPMTDQADGQAILSNGPCSHVMVGPCATGGREPGQGREAAAFSGISGVPQVA